MFFIVCVLPCPLCWAVWCVWDLDLELDCLDQESGLQPDSSPDVWIAQISYTSTQIIVKARGCYVETGP